MPEDRVVIRQSKRGQYGFVIVTGLLIIWYFIGPYEKTRIMYSESPNFTIILGILIFSLFFYFLKELIKNEPEIILTKQGIELRHNGYFDWQFVESFETVHKLGDNPGEDLLIRFRGFSDIRFETTYLEKKGSDLVDLMSKYKGSADIIFIGQNEN